jgi:riboflavin kinase
MSNSLNSSKDITVPKDFIGEKEWFFLYWIAKARANAKCEIPTSNLLKTISISQQTASRRIIALEEEGYLSRDFKNNEGYLDITAKGYVQLERVYNDLKSLFEEQVCIEKFNGTLIKGMGEGRHYIKKPQYLEQFYKKIGFFPYFGTLNVKMESSIHDLIIHHLKDFSKVEIRGFTDDSRTYGDVECYKVLLWPEDDIHKQIHGAFLRIERTSHEPFILEFICEQYLREFWNLVDGSKICFQFIKNHE